MDDLTFIFFTATCLMKRGLKSEFTLALLVSGFFVAMAVLNMAAEWDRMNSTEQEIKRLREELFLNVSQEEKITLLNKDFYEELAQAYSASYSSKEEFCTIVNRIIASHNHRVAQMLNADQRKKWQSLIACP